jgi:hypothetical protein
MCSAGADQIGIRFDDTTVLPLVFIRNKTRMAHSMGEGWPSHRRAKGMAQQPPLSSIQFYPNPPALCRLAPMTVDPAARISQGRYCSGIKTLLNEWAYTKPF